MTGNEIVFKAGVAASLLSLIGTEVHAMELLFGQYADLFGALGLLFFITWFIIERLDAVIERFGSTVKEGGTE